MKRRFVFFRSDGAAGPWETLVRLRNDEMVAALAAQDVEAIEIRLADVAANPRSAFKQILAAKPDALLAANFNYLLLALIDLPRLLEQGIPLVCLWDDPLWALTSFFEPKPDGWGANPRGVYARSILGGFRYKRRAAEFARREQAPDKSPGNAASSGLPVPPPWFAELMSHPSMIHVAWDSGQVQMLEELGIIPANTVRWHPVATYGAFLNQGARPPQSPAGQPVSFVGNVYLHALHGDPLWQDQQTRALLEGVCAAKAQHLGQSAWDHLTNALATRRPLSWREFVPLYRLVSSSAVNSLSRLAVLSGIARDVSLYGVFADPESRTMLSVHGNLRFAGEAHHFDELPGVYANTHVNVCVSNGLIHQGTPSKYIDCVASGGFGLCDHKQDLVRLFGPDAKQVMFDNSEQLNERMEHFLSHPDQRQQIARWMYDVVARECSLQSLFRAVIEEVDQSASGGERNAARSAA